MRKIKQLFAELFPKFRMSKNIKHVFIKFLLLLSISPTALADDDTVTTVVYNICDWLSGAPAVAVGVLAVIYSGYEMLHGDINKKHLIVRCVAVAIIIGGSYIGKQIIMKGIA
jgi:type IV secretory pathway VirB2 component (pilin)